MSNTQFDIYQYQEETSLGRWPLEAVPILGTKNIPTTMLCAAMAGLGGLIIDLIAVVVGKFFTCRDIPNRYNPDGMTELFRVAVGITRMIDIACCVLARTPINGIALIQAEDIDVACG